MKRKPPSPPAGPPSSPPGAAPPGSSGLPNLDDFETEATFTRQTETSQFPPASVRYRVRPVLTVLTGVDAGRSIVVEGEAVVGRATDCHLVLSETGVSRHHAKISGGSGGFIIADLGSKNGTFVDGERISAAQPLEANQVVQIGPHVTVRFAMLTDAEEKLARELFDSSMRDPLTRAYNRRYFTNRLKAEMTFANRHKTILSVLAFDLDNFKALNDTYGHAAGDAVLKRVVAVANQTLRAEDVLARIGGEEFAVLLRAIDHGRALACAERLRMAVASTPEPYQGATIGATISVGIADTEECGSTASRKLLELADKRLYKAKAAGRNRVCRD